MVRKRRGEVQGGAASGNQVDWPPMAHLPRKLLARSKSKGKVGDTTHTHRGTQPRRKKPFTFAELNVPLVFPLFVF